MLLTRQAVFFNAEIFEPKRSSNSEKNNAHRLYQYIFATPCNDGEKTKVAVIRVDAMYNENDSINRAYSLKRRENRNRQPPCHLGAF